MHGKGAKGVFFPESMLDLGGCPADRLPPLRFAPPLMTAEEHHHQRLRFARIRRVKWLLRFMPRRARFHTYPVVGRFAAFARKRSYLWSFRYAQARPALYAGSVLTLIPIPGQLPVAFILCLIFRTNFMLMGGLQFVSNPATSVPFLLGTYKLGAMTLDIMGLSDHEARARLPAEFAAPFPTDGADDVAAEKPPSTARDATGEKKTWRQRFSELLGDRLPPAGDPMTMNDWRSVIGHVVSALLIGAILGGLALGAVMDLVWRYLVLPAARLRAVRKPITATVTTHDTSLSAPPEPPAPPAT